MSTHHACTCIQCCNARTVPRSEAVQSDVLQVLARLVHAIESRCDGPVDDYYDDYLDDARKLVPANLLIQPRKMLRSADPQPEKVIYDLNCRVAELKRAILRAMQSAEDAGILGAEAFGILQGVVHDGIPAPPQPAPEQCFAEGYAWGFGDGILGGGRRDFDALRGWLDRQRRESPTPVEAALEGYTPFSKRPRSKALERLAVEARNYWDSNDDGHRCAYGDLCPSCEVRDALDVLDALEKGTLDASVSNASETPSGRAEMGSDAASAGARAAPSRARGVGVDAGPLEGREAVAAPEATVSLRAFEPFDDPHTGERLYRPRSTDEAGIASCPDGTEPDEPADRGFVCSHEAVADEALDFIKHQVVQYENRRALDGIERALFARGAALLVKAGLR